MYIGIMSGKLCEESLVGFKCITRFYLAITRYISRELKIRSVYHRSHWLRAEEVVEATVVPDYPEAVFLGYFVAYLLAAGNVLCDNAVEVLTVKLCALAYVHLVVNYLKYRVL